MIHRDATQEMSYTIFDKLFVHNTYSSYYLLHIFIIRWCVCVCYYNLNKSLINHCNDPGLIMANDELLWTYVVGEQKIGS